MTPMMVANVLIGAWLAFAVLAALVLSLLFLAFVVVAQWRSK